MCDEGGLPGFGLIGGEGLAFDGGSTVEVAQFGVARMMAQDSGFVAFCRLRSAELLRRWEGWMVRVGVSPKPDGDPRKATKTACYIPGIEESSEAIDVR